ncbi:MAG: hypothetical protein JO182_16415 [Acidobacteriaceae bacterium]|nr:hypothetical protein [Acidobacteriaceae bacterium]
MNGFLLDTNVPSELTHARPDETVRSWFTAQPAASLFAPDDALPYRIVVFNDFSHF